MRSASRRASSSTRAAPAPTDEIVRLNKVVGSYGGYYTSHVRNRDAHLQDSIDEFLQIIREGGTKGEISHLNVRHRTGAAPGAWQRAVDTMQEAREVEGLDVLADTTPFRDGLGQMAGILPPWVLADGWEEACKRLRDPAVKDRLRGDCDRYWRFIHKGDWHRVRLQASLAVPGPRGHPVRRRGRADGARAVGCLLRDPRRGRAGDREPAPDRRALHRRAPRRDDLAPALLPRRRRLHGLARRRPRRGRRAPGLLRRARALPHAPRRRGRHAAARGGDPQDDRDAGARTSASTTAAS